MKKLLLATTALMFATTLPVRADAIVYAFSDLITTNNIFTVSGTITTDGTLRPLSTANITDWSITVLKKNGFGQISSRTIDHSSSQTSITGDALSATSNQLLFDYSSSPVDRLLSVTQPHKYRGTTIPVSTFSRSISASTLVSQIATALFPMVDYSCRLPLSLPFQVPSSVPD